MLLACVVDVTTCNDKIILRLISNNLTIMFVVKSMRGDAPICLALRASKVHPTIYLVATHQLFCSMSQDVVSSTNVLQFWGHLLFGSSNGSLLAVSTPSSTASLWLEIYC